MKILVVQTGISTVVEAYKDRYGREVKFDVVSPFMVPAENINCAIYPRFVACIKDAVNRNFDGAIIIQGSSTVQYTAAALSYVVSNRSIPVVLVPQEHIEGDDSSPGLADFKAAVEFIKGEYGKGVYVVYQNKDENVKVHQGIKCLPYACYDNSLHSFKDEFYGEFVEDEFVRNQDCEAILVQKKYRIVDNISEESSILWINQYPGMSYPKIDSFTKAIMISSYLGGTVNLVSKEAKNFFRMAKNYDIPVYLSGAADVDYSNYEINVLPEESPITSYVRLWMEYCAEEVN